MSSPQQNAKSDATDGAERQRVEGPIICPGHSRPVPDMAYSNVVEDGYFMISSCLDGRAMIREGKTGDWIGTLLGHKGAVWCARLNKECTQAVTGSADFTAKLWNAITGDEIHSFEHKHVVKACTFSNDSTQVFTGSLDKHLRQFDLGKLGSDPTILQADEAVTHTLTTPDPNMILYCGREKNVRIFDLRENKVVKTLETESPLTGLTMTLDQSVICTTSGRDVHFWDANDFSPLKKYTLPQDLSCVSLDPKSKRFVTGGTTELWVRAYDYETGKEVGCNKGHHGPVRCIGFNPSGDSYASGSEDGTIRIWEWASANAQ